MSTRANCLVRRVRGLDRVADSRQGLRLLPDDPAALPLVAGPRDLLARLAAVAYASASKAETFGPCLPADRARLHAEAVEGFREVLHGGLLRARARPGRRIASLASVSKQSTKLKRTRRPLTVKRDVTPSLCVHWTRHAHVQPPPDPLTYEDLPKELKLVIHCVKRAEFSPTMPPRRASRRHRRRKFSALDTVDHQLEFFG